LPVVTLKVAGGIREIAICQVRNQARIQLFERVLELLELGQDEEVLLLFARTVIIVGKGSQIVVHAVVVVIIGPSSVAFFIIFVGF